MPKFVFSTTLETAEWNSRIIRGDLAAEVGALKEQIDGDLIFIGGGGARLLPELDSRINLELVECTVFGGGVVLHRYTPR